MKAFEFKPKLFTTLQNYSKESFMADLPCNRHVQTDS